MAIDLDECNNDVKYHKPGRPPAIGLCKNYGKRWKVGAKAGKLLCSKPGKRKLKAKGYCQSCYLRLRDRQKKAEKEAQTAAQEKT